MLYNNKNAFQQVVEFANQIETGELKDFLFNLQNEIAQWGAFDAGISFNTYFERMDVKNFSILYQACGLLANLKVKDHSCGNSILYEPKNI